MGNICIKKEDSIPLSPSKSNPLNHQVKVHDNDEVTKKSFNTIAKEKAQAADLKESKLDSIFKAKRANVFTQGNAIKYIILLLLLLLLLLGINVDDQRHAFKAKNIPKTPKQEKIIKQSIEEVITTITNIF